jgi:hypothetical protein
MCHPCGQDMYMGSCEITSPSSFSQAWTVTGPRKEGCITSVYSKLSFSRDDVTGDQGNFYCCCVLANARYLSLSLCVCVCVCVCVF